jgi:hypothetical protein
MLHRGWGECVGQDGELTVWQGDEKRLDLREHVNKEKLAVRQPGNLMAESLAVSDLGA